MVCHCGRSRSWSNLCGMLSRTREVDTGSTLHQLQFASQLLDLQHCKNYFSKRIGVGPINHTRHKRCENKLIRPQQSTWTAISPDRYHPGLTY
ncbi:uncharacterized protein BDCG_17395 [Blastomyces dermatitidis ER-3]|uniref:Uncharacterized protein n=2 Tax=Blastomyces TaxID=229219 RepID=A0A179V002_BLAGS|nr:uncharacterized protein BDBG_17796 [Blastomyces gilchristii SLH14081]XP_045281854.1 uncharacterized protein BDCG_17395 [Blastomyces dermatitidis ER-3]OAT02127.1 hypothetical protein BDCG_17395 [Blastomyces dermatitidis ER-3]OAT13393.1 hypothetical protein BDBG_17796 [Blastomyces gilchristii SLH14081]